MRLARRCRPAMRSVFTSLAATDRSRGDHRQRKGRQRGIGMPWICFTELRGAAGSSLPAALRRCLGWRGARRGRRRCLNGQYAVLVMT